MFNPMNFSEKTFLVTGASSGIGAGTAVYLSKLGARIILVARREDKLNEVLEKLEGTGHKAYLYDLKDVEGIESFFSEIIKENGPLDGIAYCAGIGPSRPLNVTNYEFINEVMRINFYAFLELTRLFAKKKNNNGGGSVVVVSSLAAKRGGPAKTAYSASKAAIDGAVKSLSWDLNPKKIHINSVQPGWVRTELYDRYLEEGGKKKEDNEFIPTLAEVEDIASTIAFLLSDGAINLSGESVQSSGLYY